MKNRKMVRTTKLPLENLHPPPITWKQPTPPPKIIDLPGMSTCRDFQSPPELG